MHDTERPPGLFRYLLRTCYAVGANVALVIEGDRGAREIAQDTWQRIWGGGGERIPGYHTSPPGGCANPGQLLRFSAGESLLRI